jgi:small GTP-binding protein
MTSSFKILIFGDGGVGKTTLIQRYVTGSFNQSQKITIGVDFFTKTLFVNEEKVILQIWDFGGENRFRFILPAYCAGAKGGIFAFDTTRLESLLHINDWLEVVRGTVPTLPIIMVGTKADLVDHRSVATEEIETKMQELAITDLFEVSSKTGQNVEEVFDAISRHMLGD